MGKEAEPWGLLVRVRYTEAKRARFYRLALPDAESAEGVTTAPQTLTTGPPNPSIYLLQNY